MQDNINLLHSQEQKNAGQNPYMQQKSIQKPSQNIIKDGFDMQQKKIQKVLIKTQKTYSYVSNKSELENACRQMRQSNILGVDLECENNLHHYGVYISIIQVSDGNNSWIIDVLSEDFKKELKPLIDIFEDDSKQKIFHDVGFDLRILCTELNCKVRNVFDTQLAALLVGKKELGLGALLEEYCNVKKQRKFQMADWTKRPLSEELLDYATSDSKYLIRLRAFLVDELKLLGRLDWAMQEFAHIQEQKLEYVEGTFWSIKGLGLITDEERIRLKTYYDMREKLAQKVNRPIHFVINTKKLIELAKSPPADAYSWSKITGVHPIVKNYAKVFDNLTRSSLGKTLPMPEHEKRRFTPEQKEESFELSLIQNSIGEKLGIARHLIMNKEQMQMIILNKNLDSLRNWQRSLVEEDYNKMRLRLEKKYQDKITRIKEKKLRHFHANHSRQTL